jgi:hypothetical protein
MWIDLRVMLLHTLIALEELQRGGSQTKRYRIENYTGRPV